MKAYILGTGTRINPYINILAGINNLGKKNHNKLDKIFFIISRSNNNDEDIDSLTKNISDMLLNLSNGKYEDKNGLRTFEKGKDLYKEIKCMYSDCKIEVIKAKENEYALEVKKLVENKNECDLIDVTTLGKNILIESILNIDFKKLNNLYYFNIIKKPEYDERDLYHALTNVDYKYENLGNYKNSIESKKINVINRMLESEVFLNTLIVIKTIFGGHTNS